MKKTLSLIISLILIAAVIAPMNVSADANTDWINSQADGTILYVPNFNGDAGIYEPLALKGTPVVTVDPNNSNSITVDTSSNKTASMWGGFINTLPLNKTTCYTIYYTVIRTGNHAVGVYCDSVYGIYGYPGKTRILQNTSDLPGHGYVEYAVASIDAPVDADASGQIIQEFALEVNGVNQIVGNYIKDKTGEFKLIDASVAGEIEYFNADVLGLFFYSYYAGHTVTVSDVKIAKGLAFSTAEYPETTEAPDTTAAPDTTSEATTEALDTEAPVDTPEQTEAPVDAPEATKAPETEPAAKGGCGSMISAGVLLTAMAAAFVALKKRK